VKQTPGPPVQAAAAAQLSTVQPANQPSDTVRTQQTRQTNDLRQTFATRPGPYFHRPDLALQVPTQPPQLIHVYLNQNPNKPVFSGTPEEDVKDFFRIFEDYAAAIMGPASNDEWTTELGNCLLGLARMFYKQNKNQNPAMPYNWFKKALISRFSESQGPWNNSLTLFQLVDEPVAAFATRLRETVRTDRSSAHLSHLAMDQRLKELFMRQALPYIIDAMKGIWRKDHLNFIGMLKIAREVEAKARSQAVQRTIESVVCQGAKARANAELTGGRPKTYQRQFGVEGLPKATDKTSTQILPSLGLPTPMVLSIAPMNTLTEDTEIESAMSQHADHEPILQSQITDLELDASEVLASGFEQGARARPTSSPKKAVSSDLPRGLSNFPTPASCALIDRTSKVPTKYCDFCNLWHMENCGHARFLHGCNAHYLGPGCKKLGGKGRRKKKTPQKVTQQKKGRDGSRVESQGPKKT
jgi:hypothetical protein